MIVLCDSMHSFILLMMWWWMAVSGLFRFFQAASKGFSKHWSISASEYNSLLYTVLHCISSNWKTLNKKSHTIQWIIFFNYLYVIMKKYERIKNPYTSFDWAKLERKIQKVESECKMRSTFWSILYLLATESPECTSIPC